MIYMKANQTELTQALPLALICGLLGGGLLISRMILTTRGWWTLLIYAIVMIATMLILKSLKKIKATYLTAVVTGVLTFMIMTCILYVYYILFRNIATDINWQGHALRLLVMLATALASSALLGLFFLKRSHLQEKIQQ
jgi:hypothetical protein